MPPKNASRSEKGRKRRADGLLRHQQDLAEKHAEIDHLHGSLTGAFGQLANFEGVAEIIRDYQKCMQPWDGTTNRLTWSIAGVAVGGGSEMGWRLRG
jgi:hypothetical protein